MASASCASREMEPCDMACVEKRLTMDSTGSTSSSGMGFAARLTSSASRRLVSGRRSTSCANFSKAR